MTAALTPQQASFAAIEGMARAADHAERVTPTWNDRALGLLLAFAAMSGEAWLLEDAREWAQSQGLPDPPDGRAWGHVAQRAKRLGAIESVGFGAARSSHGSAKVMWRGAA